MQALVDVRSALATGLLARLRRGILGLTHKATQGGGPERRDRRLARAIHLMRFGRTREAIRLFEKLIAEDPGDSAASFQLGLALASQKDFPAAVQAFKQAVENNRTDALAFYNLGVAYGESGEYPQAIEAFSAAIQLDADDSQSHFNRARCAVKLARPDDAAKDYVRALRIGLETRDMVVLALCELGAAFRQLGQHDEAAVWLRDAIAEDPSCVRAYKELGDAHAAAGRHLEAAQAYRIAIWLDADCRDAYFGEAAAYSRAGRNLDCIRVYRTMSSRWPQDIHALRLLCSTYQNLGYAAEAEGLRARISEITAEPARHPAEPGLHPQFQAAD